MTTTRSLITAEELWAMPNDATRELVRGEVKTMAPTGFDHGAIVVRLGSVIDRFVRDHKLGVVVAGEAGFVLARNPDIVRGADIGFVAASRVAASGRTAKYWEGAPDLAIEVVSPTDTLSDVEEKVDDYLAAGTRMVWVVNPRRLTVTVHKPGANPAVFRSADTLGGDDVLPDFRCPVAEIFS